MESGNNSLRSIRDKKSSHSEITIKALDIYRRTKNTLRKNRVNTIDDLKKYTLLEFLQIRGIGKNCFMNLINSLEGMGIKLEDVFTLTSNDIFYANKMLRLDINDRNSDIQKLGINIRTYNALVANGITRIEDLRKVSLQNVLDFKNFGMECMKDLIQMLIRNDLDPHQVLLIESNTVRISPSKYIDVDELFYK